MSSHLKKPYRIACFYDTETTTIGEGSNVRAFPYLFIFNDVRECGIADYNAGNGIISFPRTEAAALAYILQMVDWGTENGVIPIIAAYNLMFDLQPLLASLRLLFDFEVCAQTSTSVYTLDLLDVESGEKVLRFWDTFYLEMNGLAAMGKTAGLPKMIGDLDYSLVRTPETPLTETELGYAARDVEVIPAYLAYLLRANDYMQPDDLGVSVLTKTSVVRQMAKRKLGHLKVTDAKGKEHELFRLFQAVCNRNFPKDFKHYALRKACFRGGFTFTAARFAHKAVENVCSLDETSAHHAFINGKMVPVDFRDDPEGKNIRNICDQILLTDPLENYGKPFTGAFHAQISFTNLRLKKGSVFEAYEIGLLPEAKFYANIDLDIRDYRNVETEKAIRANGYHDLAVNGTFAYGKLMQADQAVCFVNECEFCAIAHVYDFDSFEVLQGEMTIRFNKPPDYVTLQSMMLFEQKSEIKRILHGYTEGNPYEGDVSDLVPDAITAGLRDGTLEKSFLQSYYQTTVKGSFNGIYGTQAMDEVRCEYTSTPEGELLIDRETVPTPENYDDRAPENSKVFYQYGMRIVGWSRVQLVLAMELLYKRFGEKCRITGGDTDSIKASLAPEITNVMLLDALKPLHDATTESIEWCTERARSLFPQYASSLYKVGTFDIEDCGGAPRYAQHVEFWNKARASLDVNGKVHLTCAGVSALKGAANADYVIESFMKQGMSFETACGCVFRYGSFLTNPVCHMLQRVRPDVSDMIEEPITDYRGHTCMVESHQSIALYECGRLLGAATERANVSSINYQQAHNRAVPVKMVEVGIKPDSVSEAFPYGEPYVKRFMS